MLKKAIGFMLLLLVVVVIGCGGGGGGGGGNNGGNNNNGGDNGANPDSTIVGRVVSNFNGLGIGNVTVKFLNASNVQVGTAVSRSTGWFDAIIPSSAVRFTLVSSTIPSGYFKIFTYNGDGYSTLISTCTAPLPTITDGVQTTLPQYVRLAGQNEPPPSPSGCVGN